MSVDVVPLLLWDLTMRIPSPRSAWIVVAGLAGCAGNGSVPAESGPSVDEEAILAALGDFRTSPAFRPVNQNTYETALGTGAAINVFVSAGSFDAYSQISADVTGSGVNVPEGTLIVREVLDAPGGKVQTLTLMYKGPAGYNPDLGDFWFGVTDPSGVVVEDGGVHKAGRLEECYGCHIPRADDGYLFGVPSTNRPGVTPPEEPPPVEEPPPGEPPPPVCGDFRCNADENCAVCDYDCGQCPPPEGGDDGAGEDDDHGGGDDDDDHGGGDDDDDDDHGGGDDD